MTTITLSAFFMTVFLNQLIPGPVLLLVLTRTASAGHLAGISTVIGVLFARVVTLTAALAAIIMCLELSASLQSILRVCGLALMVWLAWQVWNTPRPDQNVNLSQPPDIPGYDLVQGLLAGISSPYSLFLMFGLLPTLIVPTELDANQIILLSAVVLIATVIPLLATIWAGVALHHLWSQHSRSFARSGAIVMLGFASFGFLNLH